MARNLELIARNLELIARNLELIARNIYIRTKNYKKEKPGACEHAPDLFSKNMT